MLFLPNLLNIHGLGRYGSPVTIYPALRVCLHREGWKQPMFEEYMASEPKKPVLNSGQGPLCNERITRFKALLAMFKEGTIWINRKYQTHLLPDGTRRCAPSLATQVKRFEEEIMAPLDRLWSEMTGEEKTACGKLQL